MLEFVAESKLPFYVGKRHEQELAEIRARVGGAHWDAVLRSGSKDFAESVVNVGGGQEGPSNRGGEFVPDFPGFQELLFLAGVENAERRVGGRAREAATATVGGFKPAAVGFGVFAR